MKRALTMSMLALILLTQAQAALAREVIDVWLPTWAWTYPEVINEFMTRFQQEHPEYEINVTVVAGGQSEFEAKLLTAIAGGTSPDLSFFNRASLIEVMALHDLLVPVDEVLEVNGLSGQSFLQSLENQLTMKGRLYGVPYVLEGRGLFYNRTLFDEAGLDRHQPPKTIDELDEFAQRLTRREADGYDQFGFSPSHGGMEAVAWMWGFGGDVFDWNTGQPTLAGVEGNLKALEWIQSYGNRYNAADVTAFFQENGGVLPAFGDGKYAMLGFASVFIRIAQRDYPGLDFTYAILPYAEGGRVPTYSGGGAWVIPRGADNLTGAGKLLAYLVDLENEIEYFERSGNLPVRRDSIARLLEMLEGSDDTTILNVVRTAEFLNPTPPGWRAIYSSIPVGAIFSGQISPAEALITAQQRVENAFAEMQLIEKWR